MDVEGEEGARGDPGFGVGQGMMVITYSALLVRVFISFAAMSSVPIS